MAGIDVSVGRGAMDWSLGDIDTPVGCSAMYWSQGDRNLGDVSTPDRCGMDWILDINIAPVRCSVD